MLVQTPTPTNPPSTQADVVAITGVKSNPTPEGCYWLGGGRPLDVPKCPVGALGYRALTRLRATYATKILPKMRDNCNKCQKFSLIISLVNLPDYDDYHLNDGLLGTFCSAAAK
jgi:hypothetical protein